MNGAANRRLSPSSSAALARHLSSNYGDGNGTVSSSTVPTEGWLELFLTPAEKLHFLTHHENVRDKSLVRSVTHSWFETMARYLPDTVAPSVITLAGFLSLGQAWYLVNAYGSLYPTACTIMAAINILLFWSTNSLVPIHADRVRQHSSMGDLFKYSVDMGSTVWLTMLTTYCLGGTSVETMWYAVQSAQLVLFLKHLSAFKRQDALRYRLAAGPGEVLVTCMMLLTLRVIVGEDGLQTLYGVLFRQPVLRLLSRCMDVSQLATNNDSLSGDLMVRYFYYGLFVAAVVQSLLVKPKYGWTRFGLVSSLGMRLVPAVLLQAILEFQVKTIDVVCDGLFLTVLTSDLILARMAGRQLHPWVVLMSLAAVLSHSVILTLVAIYYIAVFCDLSFYLNLPLLATCRNVYCDGVYDLCHIGHKKAFQNALGLGNRLFVGVVNDKDASSYKRPPIMTHEERCAEVQACKAVTKVIPNAPCFGLTQEFLDEHQIHIVAFGEEYLDRYPDPKTDPYYGYVRQVGIARTVPRTNTLSTTDLIKRILTSASADKKSPT